MNLEDRIKRRLLMEDPIFGPEKCFEFWVADHDMVPSRTVARVTALEAEDSANPIAQTEQVRPPLRLNIDIAALQAVYDDLDHE